MPTLLVTGASGYLGAALSRHAMAAGWDVVGSALANIARVPVGVRSVELDVRDAAVVAAVVADAAPDAVIHTAYVQEGPEAEAVNGNGAANVAAAAARAGIRLVHVSTDIVFSGTGSQALREEDLVGPVTAYGASKATAERAVAAAHAPALIARTSLIYGGPDGPLSGHEKLALAAARGERDVTFYADEVRSPVQVDDLAAALLELTRHELAGILHVAGADAVDRHAFACLVVVAHGEDPARLAAGPRPPDRPGHCALDSARARALLATRLRGVREVLR